MLRYAQASMQGAESDAGQSWFALWHYASSREVVLKHLPEDMRPQEFQKDAYDAHRKTNLPKELLDTDAFPSFKDGMVHLPNWTPLNLVCIDEIFLWSARSWQDLADGYYLIAEKGQVDIEQITTFPVLTFGATQRSKWWKSNREGYEETFAHSLKIDTDMGPVLNSYRNTAGLYVIEAQITDPDFALYIADNLEEGPGLLCI
jgi:hypothetical protein